jgi:hypothetical protein
MLNTVTESQSANHRILRSRSFSLKLRERLFLRLHVFAMGVVVAKELEYTHGLQMELCFGDAFVYQTCLGQSNHCHVNVKIAQKRLTFRGSIDGF